MDDAVELAAAGVVVLLVTASVIVPLLGRRPGERRRRPLMTVTYLGIAAIAVLFLGLGLAIPVFLGAVALNALFGEAEPVPLSRYPMFARPVPVSWYVRLEDEAGQPLSATKAFGIPSSAVRKRFASDVQAVAGRPGAVTDGTDEELAAAGARVAEYLIALDRRADADGRIRIVHVAIAEGDDGLRYDRRVIADRT